MTQTMTKSSILCSTRVLVVVTVSLFLLSGVATAQTLNVLYSFTGGADGGFPASPLVLDQQGNLYGTTVYGGAIPPQCSISGCGVVFELSPAGAETVLHTFSWGDGAAPNALLRDAFGNVYVATQVGGSEAGGVVASFSPTGTETLLYSFPGEANGAFPRAGLIRDNQGNLYGTTEQGGYFGGACSNGGCGTVFKISPKGTETVLYSFTGAPDASYPTGKLTADAHGNLWGTTTAGGSGNGTVFRVTPSGTESVIYSFTGQADGGYPFGGLIRDGQGNFYGTTALGGYFGGSCNSGCGTIFALAPSGTETVLYSFKGIPDGSNPAAGLIRDSKGNLFGTTELGGNPANSSGSGTIFKLTPAGKEIVLYEFTGGADGAYPLAGLVRDQLGNFYGTTEEGGASGFGSTGYGTVFKLVP